MLTKATATFLKVLVGAILLIGPLGVSVDAYGILKRPHNSQPSFPSSLQAHMSSITTTISTGNAASMDRRTLLRQQLMTTGSGAGSILLLLLHHPSAATAASSPPPTTVSNNNALDSFLSDVFSITTTSTSSNNNGATTAGIRNEAKTRAGSGGAAKWPDAPSPLPSAVKSAAELTAIPEPQVALSDLEQALVKAATPMTKNQVSPRSHGY